MRIELLKRGEGEEKEGDEGEEREIRKRNSGQDARLHYPISIIYVNQTKSLQL